MNHKKRKFNSEDDERSLPHLFSLAANAVTKLYSSVEHEQKKARMQSRQLLERQFQWILREYSDKETIPTADVLRFLQDQAQRIENEENKHSSHGAQAATNGISLARPTIQTGFPSFATRAEDDSSLL